MRSCLKPVVLLAVVVTVGCSTYRPATLQSVRPGMGVRAHLTDEGESQVEEYVGREESEEVEGTLLGVSADSVFLELWRADMVTNRSFQAGRIRVPVERAQVLDVEMKTISPARTAGLAAGLIALGYVLYTEVFGGSRGGGIGGGGGGPDITVVPAFFPGR